MLFETPMNLSDRDFPGHYLRLIKRVSTSVLALIPPAEGIHATLSTIGLSRVVIGNAGIFQKINVRRYPESVALTSPINATGLFELLPQNQEMLFPFEGMVVRFTTQRSDFPPNIEDFRIGQLLLYFARADEAVFEVPVSSLLFTEQGGAGEVGGAATTVDGVISTRSGNAGSWMAMIGKPPIGEWQLKLPNTMDMKNRFRNGEIVNILFVITYSGSTPPWPE